MPRMTEKLTIENYAVAASLGDLDALGELYDHYADQVLRYVVLHSRMGLAASEDVAACVWERVARSIGRYESRREGFAAWLFTIVRNSLVDHYRAAGRNREVLMADMLVLDEPSAADGPEAMAEAQARREAVAAAVNDLSKSQRQCVTLRFFVGLSLAETAAVMGRNINAVKQLQHRALAGLRRRIGPVDGYDPAADTYVAVSQGSVVPTVGGPVR